MENGSAEMMRMLSVADAEMEEKRKKDTQCGVGSCKTKKRANMSLFTFILAATLLFHIALFSYMIGTIRTVEKRFGLSSSQTGLIGAVNDFLQIFTVLFAGYFGRKTHKPRYISITTLATVIGCFMCASPYFIYGPKKYDPALIASFAKTQDVSPDQPSNIPVMGSKFSNQTYGVPYFMNKKRSLQVCDPASNSSECSAGSQEERDSNKAAFNILVVSQLWFGIGASGIGTLGLSYIDENVKKDNSAVYIAIVTSMYALSPIIGFSLAAVSTRLAEDLSDLPIPFYHPQFVGCWWLGFVVMGILILFTSIPMFFFPKHLDTYYTEYKRPRIAAALKEGSAKVAHKKKSLVSVVISHLKGFPLALWKLISNPAYSCLTLCKVATMYIVVGHILNLPRYMEIHFGKPAYVANLVSAISGALGGATGNIIGGIIMKKFHLKPSGSIRMFIGALVITIIALVIYMLISCPQVPFAGQQQPDSQLIDVDLPCNANCSCSRDKYQPMCSSEGVMYFSPCHAGCTDNFPNGTYTNCACLKEGETLTPGACTRPCDAGFYVYVVVYFLTNFIGSTARTPATILMFRIVPEDLKAFALSINSFLFNLLVFVPGPIAFGALFDSTCLIWGENCKTRGACYFYNIRDYRLYMHGVTIVFQVVALFLAILTAYFVHKLFSKGGKLYEEDKKQPHLMEGLIGNGKDEVKEQPT